MTVIRRASRISSFLLIGVLAITYSGQLAAQEGKRNVQSDRYVINQTFDGQSFFKDNNVWVYTPKFAETFGMPLEGIDAGLKGIEAAAFRIEDTGYQLCGMGGKAENCKDNYRCVIDIYVDETKHPLPWATEQQADWLSIYNSSYWLRTPNDWVARVKVPSGVKPNVAVSGGVRPFADPETHREANYFQNGSASGNGDLDYNLVSVFGFKKNVISGLTIVSLYHNCSNRNNQKPIVTFRLESREQIASPTLKRFHEFQLPQSFNNKIEAQLQARQTRDRDYYKNLLNLK